MIDFDVTMQRIKNLAEYEVQVTVPETFSFRGQVPWDMQILGNQAFGICCVCYCRCCGQQHHTSLVEAVGLDIWMDSRTHKICHTGRTGTTSKNRTCN